MTNLQAARKALEAAAMACDGIAHWYGAINLDVTTEGRAKDYQREYSARECADRIRAIDPASVIKDD